MGAGWKLRVRLGLGPGWAAGRHEASRDPARLRISPRRTKSGRILRERTSTTIIVAVASVPSARVAVRLTDPSQNAGNRLLPSSTAEYSLRSSPRTGWHPWALFGQQRLEGDGLTRQVSAGD